MLPPGESLLALDGPRVVLTALKPPEQGTGLVARVLNPTDARPGRPCGCRYRFAARSRSGWTRSRRSPLRLPPVSAESWSSVSHRTPFARCESCLIESRSVTDRWPTMACLGQAGSPNCPRGPPFPPGLARPIGPVAHRAVARPARYSAGRGGAVGPREQLMDPLKPCGPASRRRRVFRCIPARNARSGEQPSGRRPRSRGSDRCRTSPDRRY